MDSQNPPPMRAFLLTTILLMIFGWGGLYAILANTTPNGGTRWALFFAGVLAVTGAILPVVAFLNKRFPSLPPPTTTVVVRQALWAGIYVATLGWLQIGRVLTPALALLLLAGLTMIEWLLRLRERALWKPEREQAAGD